jgi:hypothetical protein
MRHRPVLQECQLAWGELEEHGFELVHAALLGQGEVPQLRGLRALHGFKLVVQLVPLPLQTLDRVADLSAAPLHLVQLCQQHNQQLAHPLRLLMLSVSSSNRQQIGWCGSCLGQRVF